MCSRSYRIYKCQNKVFYNPRIGLLPPAPTVLNHTFTEREVEWRSFESPGKAVEMEEVKGEKICCILFGINPSVNMMFPNSTLSFFKTNKYWSYIMYQKLGGRFSKCAYEYVWKMHWLRKKMISKHCISVMWNDMSALDMSACLSCYC